MDESTKAFEGDAGARSDRFRELQETLPHIWHVIQHGRPHEYTSVIVPSLSFDRDELAKIQGVSFYEERLLSALIRLRDPRASVIYVTSQPVHPEIVDYYLQLLSGVPASHARRRLHLFCAYDASNTPLTQKVLDRPRLVERMKSTLAGGRFAYMTCFNSTHLERDLAVALGIPLNGVDPELLHFGTKSGARRVFRDAGVEFPDGVEDVHSREEIVDALAGLAERNPGLRGAVVKLDESFAGEGNATFAYPAELPKGDKARRRAIDRALDHLELSASSETVEAFLEKISSMGGIVEEWVRGDDIHSPSVQIRIDPDGEIRIISTHEQVLGGPTAQGFVGCRFPARDEYRELIQERAMAIGGVLAKQGVISRLGIDFVTYRDCDGPWRASAIEINLRMGGTTHPFLALQLLTGGDVDPKTGDFVTPQGVRKYYFATDQLKSDSYAGLLPEDFVEILARHGLHFKQSTETGVLFHMIGALSQYGKIGVTCIGNDPTEADHFYRRTVEILDRATGFSGEPGRHLAPLFDEAVPEME